MISRKRISTYQGLLEGVSQEAPSKVYVFGCVGDARNQVCRVLAAHYRIPVGAKEPRAECASQDAFDTAVRSLAACGCVIEKGETRQDREVKTGRFVQSVTYYLRSEPLSRTRPQNR